MEQDVRDTTRLLIVDAEAEEADRLVNIFRDAGQTTRAHHITSVEMLEQAFLEKKKWDLLIISRLPDDLKLSSLLENIDHQSTDIPIIIIADYKDGNERMDYLRMGIKAVVPPDQQDMLLLKASQEIENLYIRRNYRRMSIALNESERQRRLLLDDEVDAIVYVREGIIRYANPAFYELIGKDPKHAIEGKLFSELVMAAEQQQIVDFLENTEETGQALGVLQCSMALDNDEELPVRAIIKPTSYDGAFSLSLQIKSIDSPASELAVTTADSLFQSESAGLLTKQALLDQLEISIQKVASGKGQSALVHASMDGLQGIHDDKGIELSQQLEKMTEEQIVTCLGAEHSGAGLGGGQFLLLLNEGGETAVQEITQKVLAAVSGLSVGDDAVTVSLSMGAIILGDTGKDAKTLMVRAKHACAQAEKEGGGRLSFFKPRKVDVVKSVEKHIAMMLSQAMKNDALKLYYQPVVSLKGTEGNYYEVLFSMTDMRGREHYAANFRTKLDNESLWGRVDRWQFAEAVKTLSEKRKDGNDTRLFIHLGGCVLNDEKFVPWITSVLQSSGLPAAAVTLEVSEANIARYGKVAPAFFDAVKNAGFSTAVSEFGCSVNPLEMLESVNIDFIKVDPSFTKELTSDSRGEEFKEILAKVAGKGKQIIVPQVQNTAALAPLWHSGVDYVQGAFLQEPAESMNYSFDSDF